MEVFLHKICGKPAAAAGAHAAAPLHAGASPGGVRFAK